MLLFERSIEVQSGLFNSPWRSHLDFHLRSMRNVFTLWKLLVINIQLVNTVLIVSLTLINLSVNRWQILVLISYKWNIIWFGFVVWPAIHIFSLWGNSRITLLCISVKLITFYILSYSSSWSLSGAEGFVYCCLLWAYFLLKIIFRLLLFPQGWMIAWNLYFFYFKLVCELLKFFLMFFSCWFLFFICLKKLHECIIGNLISILNKLFSLYLDIIACVFLILLIEGYVVLDWNPLKVRIQIFHIWKSH